VASSGNQQKQPLQAQMMQQSTVPHKTEVKVENTIKVPPNLVTAQRVAELLKAAGETFCRLGDCTMLLQPQTANPVKTKWFDTDVTQLADCVSRFKNDLSQLSATMQTRTSQKLKDSLRRKIPQQNPNFRQGPRVGAGQGPVKREGTNQQGMGNPCSPDKRQRIQTVRTVQSMPESGQGSGRQQNQNYQNTRVLTKQVNVQQTQNKRVTNPNRSPVPIQRQQGNGHQQNWVQNTGSGQRLVQVAQPQTNVVSSNSINVPTNQSQQIHTGNQIIQGTQQIKVQHVQMGGGMGQGTTRLVMGADQNGPKYTVQETVIDGKKTLILDHNDLARLLQSNNQAVVLQQGNGDSGQVQGGQTITVMQNQQNQHH
jgi:hypothetical protein